MGNSVVHEPVAIVDGDLARIVAEFKEVTRSIRAKRPVAERWQRVQRLVQEAIHRHHHRPSPAVDGRATQRSMAITTRPALRRKGKKPMRSMRRRIRSARCAAHN